jgi:hypothetical protein
LERGRERSGQTQKEEEKRFTGVVIVVVARGTRGRKEEMERALKMHARKGKAV